MSFFPSEFQVDFLDQIQVDELDGPDVDDWADYAEYLDSIGYDNPDEEVIDRDEQTGLEGRGFDGNPFPF